MAVFTNSRVRFRGLALTIKAQRVPVLAHVSCVWRGSKCCRLVISYNAGANLIKVLEIVRFSMD